MEYEVEKFSMYTYKTYEIVIILLKRTLGRSARADARLVRDKKIEILRQTFSGGADSTRRNVIFVYSTCTLSVGQTVM